MNEYIKGHCYTNLDDWKRFRWPTRFVAIPRVGDVVKSEEGRELKVVRVIHLSPRDRDTLVESPCLEIELHKG